MQRLSNEDQELLNTNSGCSSSVQKPCTISEVSSPGSYEDDNDKESYGRGISYDLESHIQPTIRTPTGQSSTAHRSRQAESSRARSETSESKIASDSDDDDDEIIGVGRRSYTTSSQVNTITAKSGPESSESGSGDDDEDHLECSHHLSKFTQNARPGRSSLSMRSSRSRREKASRECRSLSPLSVSDDSDEHNVFTNQKALSRRTELDPAVFTDGKNDVASTRVIRKETEFRRLLSRFDSIEAIRMLYPRRLWPEPNTQRQKASERSILLDFASLEATECNDVPETLGGTEFVYYNLSEVSIYRSIHHRYFPGQLESLHIVATEQEDNMFYLDGWIEHEGLRMYLEIVPIIEVSIGPYMEPAAHTSEGHIYVQTMAGRNHDSIWYRIRSPSWEYRSLWRRFSWLADLSKHFIDYLYSRQEIGDVRIQSFTTGFLKQLQEWHQGSPAFQDWHVKCGSRTDFRKDIAAHAAFLYNQVHNTMEADHRQGSALHPLFRHPVWKSILPKAFPPHPDRTPKDQKTTVSKNIGRSFLKAFPQWGKEDASGKPGFNIIKIVHPCDEVLAHQEQRRQILGLPDKFSIAQATDFHDVLGEGLRSKVDLTLQRAPQAPIKIARYTESLQSRLVIIRIQRKKLKDWEYQYALVQTPVFAGSRVRVLWLLPPSQTSCGEKTFYPIGNELFISDKCNCEPVSLSNIVSVFDISLLADHADTCEGFFAREVYRDRDDEAMFTTGRQCDVDFQCSCRRFNRQKRTCDDIDRSWNRTLSNGPRSADAPVQKMKNMSLFSGCGLLDWGLEHSGLIETVLSIDIDDYATQSFAANQSNTKCENITGSVDDLLENLLLGKKTIFSIDCLTAGCPCKGFSTANMLRGGVRSQKNCSLVASTLSYIETLLPAYVVIENVPNIDRGDSPTACEQIFCSLVAMGYQVYKMMRTASSHGAPQRRSRLFIVATAPSFQIPDVPIPTHGKTRADLKRELTAAESAEGLDPVENDATLNITAPDHIPVHRLKCNLKTANPRAIVSKIPKMPRRMNLYLTWRKNLLNKVESDWVASQTAEKLRERAGTFCRVVPNKPYHTVMTIVNPIDARSQPMIHWQEDRVLTLAELMRAMGIPDDKVLMGSLEEKVRQCGNGVPFQLGCAIGRSVGDAWAASWRRKNQPKRQMNRPTVEIPLRRLHILDGPAAQRRIREKRLGELSSPVEGDTTSSESPQVEALLASKVTRHRANPAEDHAHLTAEARHSSTADIPKTILDCIEINPTGVRLQNVDSDRRPPPSSVTYGTDSFASKKKLSRKADILVGEEQDDEVEFLYARPVEKKVRTSRCKEDNMLF